MQKRRLLDDLQNLDRADRAGGIRRGYTKEQEKQLSGLLNTEIDDWPAELRQTAMELIRNDNAHFLVLDVLENHVKGRVAIHSRES